MPEAEVVRDLTSAGVEVRHGRADSLARLYDSAAVYLFPVRPESRGAIELPLTVLEAIARGIPVITTDFGALSWALEGVAGVWVVACDNFVDTAVELLRDPSRLTSAHPVLPPRLRIDTVVAEICGQIDQ
jgi:glycosyltransferase involved in cell wall biosynthesis